MATLFAGAISGGAAMLARFLYRWTRHVAVGAEHAAVVCERLPKNDAASLSPVLKAWG
jgi:hypothetical protein